MKNIKLKLIIALIVLAQTGVLAYKNTQQKKSVVIQGVLYVKLKTVDKQLQKQAQLESIFSNYNIRRTTQPFSEFNNNFKVSQDLLNVYKIEFNSPIDINSVINNFKQNSVIEYIEPSYIRYTDGNYTPNDSLFSQMYSLSKTDASKAWDISKGDSVVIGVIDSGYDYNHPDLATKIWENSGEKGTDSQNRDKKSNGVDDDNNGFIDDWRGWDFVGSNTTTFVPDNDPHPKSGSQHGTHTSGTAGAATDNRIGVASMGFNAKIMATKHAPDVTSNSIYFGFDGILYCIKNKADIISCSWGGTGYSQYERDVVRFALKNNILIVAAAGNGNMNVEIEPHYPSNYPEVLAVGNVDASDKRETLSNFGKPEFVQVFAPGTNILSTIPGGGYSSFFTGTSMSTPLVAGIAALIKSKTPTMSAADIMFRICGNTDSIDHLNPSYKGLMGFGRANAYKALTGNAFQPKPVLVIKNLRIDDPNGNNNKSIEPGETINLIFDLQNDWGNATNVTAKIDVNHWSVSTIKSTSNFGFINGLSNLDSSKKSNSSDPISLKFSNETIPIKIPFKLTVTADGGYSKIYDFELSVGASVLFVDDDEDFNSEKYFFSAFNKLGVVYEYWDHFSKGTPTFDFMKNYNVIVWSCEWAFPALDSTDRKELAKFLDNGGKLFISGQDIGWDLNDTLGSYPNEYVVSKGASRTFYRNYLKAKYIDDGSSTNTSLVGFANDPISDGLSFERYQPGRAATEQFGDIADTINGSLPIFKYTNGSSLAINKPGGVRFDGNYMLVHFTMGGLEAVTDTNKQLVLMKRILNWFFKTSVSVDQLNDTENSTLPYLVKAKITSSTTLQNVDLYWDTDGQLPFKKVQMTDNGNGNFTGEIPPQSSGIVEYFVLIKTSQAFMPFEIKKFKVGPDYVPPVVTFNDTLQNSIKLNGPWELIAELSDNIGIDTINSKVVVSINNSQDTSYRFTNLNFENKFKSIIIPKSVLKTGDVVNYYIICTDKSSRKNETRFPQIGTKSFVIGYEIIDDFEQNKTAIWNFGNWGYASNWSTAPGKRSITDSPGENYKPNTINILSYNQSLDLTLFTKVDLKFVYRSLLHSSDTLYFDISGDGGVTWENQIKITDFAFYAEFSQVLTKYLNKNNVKFRFRLITDAANQSDGIYLDNIEVRTNQYSVKVNESDKNLIPTEISLSQNYPNPFNPTTNIKFGLPRNTKVTLEVYDILGRKVKTLLNDNLTTGYYTIKFDATDVSSGVYFYRLVTADKSITKQMRLLK